MSLIFIGITFIILSSFYYESKEKKPENLIEKNEIKNYDNSKKNTNNKKVLKSKLPINFSNSTFQEILFKQTNKNYLKENIIISPLSLYQILSLTSNGAKSSTQEQMLSLLLPNSNNPKIDLLNKINFDILKNFSNFKTLEIANTIMSKYPQRELEQEFLGVGEKYLSTFFPLESTEQVNKWVSEKTHGKITKIIEQLPIDVVMLLINAVYFKGAWLTVFEEFLTKKKPFYNYQQYEKNSKNNTDMVMVDTMCQLFEDTGYYKSKEGIQAIELEFNKDSMKAVIILPPEKKDINDFINNVNISDIISKLTKNNVNLELPKFELDFTVKYNEILEDLGMTDAFTDSADFTGIKKEGGMKISQVLQKVFLKIDEKGAEAAAVTLVEMDESIPSDIKKMKVNRPFLFLLYNDQLPKDVSLLFMAKILKLE